jgi:tRNA pseudouridine38-40 synthase
MPTQDKKIIPPDWITYIAKISYTGTHFQGWQSQKNQHTIQDSIEKALSHIFKKEQRIIGASRTDSGVHALGQVCIFKAPRLDTSRLQNIINNILPDDIFLYSVKENIFNIHPRFDAIKKIYEYKFSYNKQRPDIARYVHHEKKYIISKNDFSQYSNLFIGTHDFRSFCSEEKDKNTVRQIFDISLDFKDDIYCVTFIGNGFLRYMIRRLLGAIIECNAEKKLETLQKIFLKKDNKNNLYSMPAKGLILKDIIYSNIKIENI